MAKAKVINNYTPKDPPPPSPANTNLLKLLKSEREWKFRYILVALIDLPLIRIIVFGSLSEKR